MVMVNNGTGTPQFGFEYGGTGERTVQNTYTGGLVSSTRAFLYDREDVAVEFSNDTFSTVFRQYIHGPGIDEPLAFLESGPEQYTYYLHDGLGSVTALVDADGDLVGCYDYGAFGNERRNTVAIENRYRYTSREYVEPNLYYYRARYMRPDLGRFVSMDPLKTIDGTNMFGYVQNDPIEYSDPLGTSSCSAANNSPENPCIMESNIAGEGCVHPDCGKDGDIKDSFLCRKIWKYVEWNCTLQECSSCDSCDENEPSKGKGCTCTFGCRFRVINPHASINPHNRPGMNDEPHNDPPYTKIVTVEGECID